MAELWDKFLFQFCKVGFVCWNGEPNWLGWVALGFAVLMILGIILGIVISTME